MDKKLCEIHHLYYRGNVCPICDEERIAKLSKKYCDNKPNVKKEKQDREINEDDIARLIEKFNVK